MQELLYEFERTLRTIIREEIQVALNRSEIVSVKVCEPASTAVDEFSNALLNSKEAASYCRISTVTLWRMRTKREVGFFRVGNRVLFSVEKHLIPFLKSRERKAK